MAHAAPRPAPHPVQVIPTCSASSTRCTGTDRTWCPRRTPRSCGPCWPASSSAPARVSAAMRRCSCSPTRRRPATLISRSGASPKRSATWAGGTATGLLSRTTSSTGCPPSTSSPTCPRAPLGARIGDGSVPPPPRLPGQRCSASGIDGDRPGSERAEVDVAKQAPPRGGSRGSSAPHEWAAVRGGRDLSGRSRTVARHGRR